MKVKLLSNSPLENAVLAARICYNSEASSDSCGEKDKALLKRVGVDSGHGTILEQLVYTFEIDGISRACLQELARHRITSLNVQSTRYTLKKMVHDSDIKVDDLVVKTGNNALDNIIADHLENLMCFIINNPDVKNDVLKYALPEAYKTRLVWTINGRSLRNFLSLRASNRALWEIQNLANSIYYNIPEDHKFLYENIINEE